MVEFLQLTQKPIKVFFSICNNSNIQKFCYDSLCALHFFLQFLLIDNHIMTDSINQHWHIYRRIWTGGLWSFLNNLIQGVYNKVSTVVAEHDKLLKAIHFHYEKKFTKLMSFGIN